jgi:hypothetical protein
MRQPEEHLNLVIAEGKLIPNLRNFVTLQLILMMLIARQSLLKLILPIEMM